MATTINVLCYRSKTLKNGEHPLMLCICKDRARKYTSLNLSVKAEHWNFDKNEPKPNCPNREHICLLIASKKAEYEKEAIKLKSEGRYYTADGQRLELSTEEFTIIEKKTGKQRTLRLNPQLQKHIQECYEHIKPIGVKAPILVSQKGTTFTIQAINRKLKDIKKHYKVKIKNFSCHSLRKTFGRQVYTMSGDSAELTLVKLMELFNHSSIAITKRYLGLRQEEILETYDVLSF